VVQFWDVKNLQLQQVKEADLIKIACSRLTQNFSEVEWKRYVGNDQPRELCEGLPVPQ
jgi:hypothetical protein